MRALLAAGAFCVLAAGCERPTPAVEEPAPASSGGPFRYVGRWAAREDLCASGAWNFAAHRLSTAGEVSCDFDEMTPNAAGYDVSATCVAQGPETPYTMTLSFPDATHMRVDGGPFASPVTLIYCDAGEAGKPLP